MGLNSPQWTCDVDGAPIAAGETAYRVRCTVDALELRDGQIVATVGNGTDSILCQAHALAACPAAAKATLAGQASQPVAVAPAL